MAASFPHQYFLNRTALISPGDFHHQVPVLTETTSIDMESADPCIFNNISCSNMVTPLMSIINVRSPVSSATSSQDHWAVPDRMHAPALFSESEKTCLSGFNYYYNPRNLVFEPGDDQCSGSQLVPSFSCQDNYDVSAENWGRQGMQVAQVTEEAQQVKVGRYTVEEKKERIIRYLKKRNQRNFKKTIKYACRKTLADKRVRVRGRFAKNIEHCDQDEAIDNVVITEACQDYSHQQFSSFYCNEALQIKYNEDEWLHFQAAMNGLIHLPYISG